MTFRDEEDAQRARADALASELADRERELRQKDRELLEMKRKLETPSLALDDEVEQPAKQTKKAPSMGQRTFALLVEHAGLLLVGVAVLVAVGIGFAVLSDESEPSRPPPALSMTMEVERPGTIIAATGASPVNVGASCMVRVVSVADETLNCRATVTCDGRALYGERAEQGFLRCTFHPDKTPAAGTDLMDSSQDRDPELWLDLSHDRVEVRDGVGASTWEVTIDLGPGTSRWVPVVQATNGAG